MRGFLYFLGGLALGGGAVYLLTRKTGAFGQSSHQSSHQSNQSTKALKNAAEVHIRQIRRYAFASSQDLSPVVGLTHASYALMGLDTLEEIAGREAAARSGISPQKLRKFITKLQDKHAEALAKCDPHLQKILAIERREGKQIPGFVVAGAWAAPMGA